MKRTRLFIVLGFLISAFLGGNRACAQLASNAPQPKNDKSFVPLENVVSVLQNVLSQVKGQIKPGDPQLQSAEFDFQTVDTNDTTGGVIVSILTIEGEHEKDVTREIDYTYSVPPPPTNTIQSAHGGYKALTPYSISDFVKFSWVKDLWDKLHATTTPEDLSQSLPAAIIAASETARRVKQISNPLGVDLSNREYTVTLTFAVTNTFNAQGDASKLLIVGPEAKFKKSVKTTQTLKLTFKDLP